MRTLIAAAATALIVCAVPALAQTAPSPSPAPSATTAAQRAMEIERSRVDTMLRTGHADPAWFAASFLAQVSASKVDEIIAAIIAADGAYRGLEATPQKFVAHFAKGDVDTYVRLDANDKIDGLLFRPAGASPNG